MPAKPKSKKAKKSSKKKKAVDPDAEEKKAEAEEFKVVMPKYGWIKITVSTESKHLLKQVTNPIAFVFEQLRLCAAPTPQYNHFTVYMLSTARVMMIHRNIVEHHGRV